jgi:hypothetical protein
MEASRVTRGLLGQSGSKRQARIALAALACCVVGALTGPAPAGATAAWLPTQALTESAQESYNPVVAADSQGTVLAAWTGTEGLGPKSHVYTAVRPPGGAFSPGLRMSPPATNASGPAVAFDSHGNAIAVWADEGIIEAAVRPAGGSFGLAQALSVGGESANSPQVIFNSQGDAIVVWASSTGMPGTQTYRVESNVRPAGGSFGLPQELDSAQQSSLEQSVSFSPIRLASDKQGNVFAMWSFSSERRGGMVETFSSAIKTAPRPAQGAFSATTTLAAVPPVGKPEFVRFPDLAADPQGDALVVWEHWTGTSAQVEGKISPAGGPFEAKAESVSPIAEHAERPRLAFDQNGNAVAVWLAGTPAGVVTASRPRGGAFGLPQQISPVGVLSQYPAVAVKPDGGALVAWMRYTEPSRIEAAERPAGGSFGSPLPVSPPGQSGGVGEPSITVDGLGDAVATWRRLEKIYHAELAGYDDAPPTLQSVGIPTRGTAGQPLAFSVSPLDVWSALGPTRWSFGDGGTSTGTSVSHIYPAAGTYKVTLTSADVLGNATATAATVVVGPAPLSMAGTPRAAVPTIESAAETNSIWREGNRLAQIGRKKKPPVGTVFSFKLNEQASVSFAFTQRVSGRKVRGKCVAPRKANRHKPSCKRTVNQGTFTFTGHSGVNRVAFQGRISRSKKLGLGSYALLIAATNSAGQRSQPESLSFTIVR